MFTPLFFARIGGKERKSRVHKSQIAFFSHENFGKNQMRETFLSHKHKFVRRNEKKKKKKRRAFAFNIVVHRREEKNRYRKTFFFLSLSLSLSLCRREKKRAKLFFFSGCDSEYIFPPPLITFFFFPDPVPPSIRADPQDGNYVVKKGRKVELRCIASGNPDPTITWSRQVRRGAKNAILPNQQGWV